MARLMSKAILTSGNGLHSGLPRDPPAGILAALDFVSPTQVTNRFDAAAIGGES
jgi:hypothetical protein